MENELGAQNPDVFCPYRKNLKIFSYKDKKQCLIKIPKGIFIRRIYNKNAEHFYYKYKEFE